MADYRASTGVDAPPERVFDYLSDVHNLPAYFDRMTSAEPADGEAVDVSADVDGEQVGGEAWFHVDNDTRTISWGSQGPHDYHGRLEVGENTGASVVTVTLSTTHEAGPEIQQGLEQTLANVKQLTEPSVG